MLVVAESKFCGVLMSCVSFVLDCARRMTWKGEHPTVHELEALDYPNGVKLSKPEMAPWEARLKWCATLPKYDITIKPLIARLAVS